MITKAIVESIVSPFQIKVRIPILHGINGSSSATSDTDLPLATINCIPGISPILQKGDIIFVGFDSNDESRPIMLGYLSKVNSHTELGDLSSQSLSIRERAVLPQNTSIGNITQGDLLALNGINGNIEIRLQTLEAQIKSIMELVNNNGEGNE